MNLLAEFFSRLSVFSSVTPVFTSVTPDCTLETAVLTPETAAAANWNIFASLLMQTTVMWSETVGLRTKTGLRPRKSVLVLVLQAVVLVLVLHTAVFILVLVLQFWCCFVKHDLVTLVIIMILKDTATF